jgi:hypothetical protein
MKPLQTLAVLSLSLMALVAPSIAEKPRKADPGPHPIKVLKVTQDSGSRETMSGTEGRYHVWLQNTTDVAVDKVALELEFYSRSGRKVETVRKEIGVLESGNKNMAEVKYEILGERSVRPRVWVMYNAGKENPAQFEVTGAQWNW